MTFANAERGRNLFAAWAVYRAMTAPKRVLAARAVPLALALSGCVAAMPEPSFDFIHLATEDGPAGGAPCSTGSLTGTLATSQDWGLGVVDANGRLRVVNWPPAFAAAHVSGRIVLLDNDRRVVASEGDIITVPGDSLPDPNIPDGVWMACNNLTVTPGST